MMQNTVSQIQQAKAINLTVNAYNTMSRESIGN